MSLNARQTKVLQWLSSVNAHSANLYQAAVKLTADASLPCRGRFVAHGYREICIGLMNLHSSKSREDMKPLLDQLADEFLKLNLAQDDISAPGDVASPPADLGEAVPRSFIDSVREVVNVHSAAPKGKQRARDVFAGLASQGAAGKVGVSQTSDRWFEMYNFFTACLHDRKTDDAVLMGERFTREVTFFEDTLLSFAEAAASNLSALDEILASANS